MDEMFALRGNLEQVFTQILRVETSNTTLSDMIKAKEEELEKLKVEIEHSDGKLADAHKMKAMLEVSIRNNRNAEQSLTLAVREQGLLYRITKERIQRQAGERIEREKEYKAMLEKGRDEIWSKFPRFAALEEKVKEEEELIGRLAKVERAPERDDLLFAKKKLADLKDKKSQIHQMIHEATGTLAKLEESDEAAGQAEGEREQLAPTCGDGGKGDPVSAANHHDSGIETTIDETMGHEDGGEIEVCRSNFESHSEGSAATTKNQGEFLRPLSPPKPISSVPASVLTTTTSHSTPQPNRSLSFMNLPSFQSITPIARSSLLASTLLVSPSPKSNLLLKPLPTRQGMAKRTLSPSVGSKRKPIPDYAGINFDHSKEKTRNEAFAFPTAGETPPKRTRPCTASAGGAVGSPSKPDAQGKVASGSRSSLFSGMGDEHAQEKVASGSRSSLFSGTGDEGITGRNDSVQKQQSVGNNFHVIGDSTIVKSSLTTVSKKPSSFVEFLGTGDSNDGGKGGKGGNPFDFSFGTGGSDSTFSFGGPSPFEDNAFGDVPF